MGDKTSISWTDATWNPTVGCTRVSAGCDKCYAFKLHDTRHVAWKRGRFPSAPTQYHQPFSHVQLMPDRLGLPLHWRKPRRIFVDSMADLFHAAVPDDYIESVWRIMQLTPQHIYQVLTKRPERMRAWVTTRVQRHSGYVPAHIWLGTSVEHQDAANERIPHLLNTPAAVRFLSCEPLLGPLDLSSWLVGEGQYEKAEWHLAHYGRSQPLSWVIVGGESGAGYRRMHPDWARRLRDQCDAANVAFFYKQGSDFRSGQHSELDGVQWHQFPEEM